MGLFARFGGAHEDEERTLTFGFIAFFLVFTAWYMIRPVREAMGISRGVGDLPWLMVGTVIATFIANPIFAKLATRTTRTNFVKIVYYFLAVNLVLFYLALVPFAEALGIDEAKRVWIGYGLFIWVSVFSLLFGSVLWSLCSEAFKPEAAGRVFGLLAGGCSLGGIVGASVAGLLADHSSEPLLTLPLAAVLIVCAAQFASRIPGTAVRASKPLEGSAFEGASLTVRSPYLLGISSYVLAYTLIGTLVYLIQGAVIDALEADMAGDIKRFASIDLWTNTGTLFIQLFCMRKLVGKLGVGWCLAIPPLIFILGFFALLAAPTYAVLASFQVISRVLKYGLAKPAREMLFTPLSRSEKYKAKNLIDLFVYRAGDATGSMMTVGLTALGYGIAGISAIAIPISGVWLMATPLLGRAFERRRDGDG